MTELTDHSDREVIRVRVKKCDGLMQPEFKKFSIDPQITSHELLQSLLRRAFEIKSNFTISYLTQDVFGRDVYTTMLSDWDMDAAFLTASDPCLRLKVDLRPFEEGLEDWDVVGPNDVSQVSQSIVPFAINNEKTASFLGNLGVSISSQLEKTINSVQRVVGFKQDEDIKPMKDPLSDAEFHSFLDGNGHLLKPKEFRLSIYRGGVEPSLRRVAWRHLLNVFPEGLSGLERFAFLKAKSEEYYQMRDKWRYEYRQSICKDEDLKFIVNMVKKDVLRTDRIHDFYAGDDENENVLTLLNILVTYAITHPSVSYCQGMSDLASPLLVVQGEEAATYICFCALMRRLKNNFTLDGVAMTTKFQHLADLISSQDPEYYNYLHSQSADDLLFTYRWLLLELKREFPFDDALYMLEVLWSSLPPDPPDSDLDLIEKTVVCDPVKLIQTRRGSLQRQETAYSRVRSLRRQVTHTIDKATQDNISETEETNEKDPNTSDQSQSEPMKEPHLPSPEYESLQNSMTHALLREESSLDRSLGSDCDRKSVGSDCDRKSVGSDCDRRSEGSDCDRRSVGSDCDHSSVPESNLTDSEHVEKQPAANLNIQQRDAIPTNVATKEASNGEYSQSDFSKALDKKAEERLTYLPSPDSFGFKNPFLMFLSATILLQHRDKIINNKMDYNDIAMHFDKMTRKHNVNKVIRQAQSMYAMYLKAQVHKPERDCGVGV